MKITRRFLLEAGGASLLVPACRPGPDHGDDHSDDTGDDPDDTAPPDTGWTWAPGPEPATDWDPGTAVQPAAFPSGAQTGDATGTGVVAMCQTSVTPIALRYARATEEGWEEQPAIEGLTGADGVIRTELADLIPDTTYALCFETTTGRSAVARFRTALYPGASRRVRFGVTSCLNDENAPWESLSFVGAEKLDFFVLLGDTVYADDAAGDVASFRAFYRTALATQGLLDLTAATSVVATWDDHEIGNDWSGPSDGAERQAAALDAFRGSIPQTTGPTGTLWRTLAWGDALELFVLDCRGERDGDTYISRAQMDWLKEALSASTARFKILLNSTPITDWSDTVIGDWAQDDRWQGHPADRDEILRHIATNGITGVLWLAGDHHFGAITHVDPTGGIGQDQIEVLCGPAGSSINLASYAIPENERYPHIVSDLNWALFEVDPETGGIIVVFVANDGSEIVRWSTVL